MTVMFHRGYAASRSNVSTCVRVKTPLVYAAPAVPAEIATLNHPSAISAAT